MGKIECLCGGGGFLFLVKVLLEILCLCAITPG